MAAPRHLALPLALLPLLAAACFEEAKNDCRTHADCRGVRQCADGSCYTPKAYDDARFQPRYDDAPTDVDQGGLIVLPLTDADAVAVDGELLALETDPAFHAVRLELRVAEGERLDLGFKMLSEDGLSRLDGLTDGAHVTLRFVD